MDWNNMFEMGGIGGGLGSMLGGIFGLAGGNKNNPADAAMPYLNRISQESGKYYDPYMQSANQMNPGMNELYQNLMNDPSGFLSKIGEGYQQSPGYQFNYDEAMRGAGNAEAAGGMLGSPEHEQRSAEVASGLASKDYQDYLKNALGILGMGVQGGENTMNRGFNAAQGMSGVNQQVLSDQAGYAYAGQDVKGQADAGNWANIFKGAGQMLPWLFM